MQSTEELNRVIREWAEVFMHRSGHDFIRFMDATGLSFSQVNVLMRLFHHGSSGVTEIGEQMGVTSAAASQSIDKLVQLGLVERVEDPLDRRAKQLSLAPKGRLLIEQGIAARSRWIEGVTEGLKPEQREGIITYLTLLTEAARKTGD